MTGCPLPLHISFGVKQLIDRKFNVCHLHGLLINTVLLFGQGWPWFHTQVARKCQWIENKYYTYTANIIPPALFSSATWPLTQIPLWHSCQKRPGLDLFLFLIIKLNSSNFCTQYIQKSPAFFRFANISLSIQKYSGKKLPRVPIYSTHGKGNPSTKGQTKLYCTVLWQWVFPLIATR